MNTDDDLRQLFADATSGIRPEGTLDDIRDRTRKVDPIAQRWFLPAMAAAAVMALVVGGAFWMTRDDDSGPGVAATPTGPVATTVYFVGQSAGNGVDDNALDPFLFPEQHQVPSVDGRPDPVTAANLAIGGKPFDPDYTSLWPAGVVVDSVEVSGSGDDSRTDVRLSGPFAAKPASMDDREQMIAINALVRTIQQATGLPRSAVSFDGPGTTSKDWTVLGEHMGGIGYFAGGDDTAQLAPVQITSLTHGQTVPTGDLVVQGRAATFEANVVWELYVGGDAVVQSGSTTAAECCSLQPYSFTVKGLEPGTYTLVAHDVDESGEGRPVNSDSKDIVVE